MFITASCGTAQKLKRITTAYQMSTKSSHLDDEYEIYKYWDIFRLKSKWNADTWITMKISDINELGHKCRLLFSPLPTVVNSQSKSLVRKSSGKEGCFCFSR